VAYLAVRDLNRLLHGYGKLVQKISPCAYRGELRQLEKMECCFNDDMRFRKEESRELVLKAAKATIGPKGLVSDDPYPRE
jgi:hypothetical protein